MIHLIITLNVAVCLLSTVCLIVTLRLLRVVDKHEIEDNEVHADVIRRAYSLEESVNGNNNPMSVDEQLPSRETQSLDSPIEEQSAFVYPSPIVCDDNHELTVPVDIPTLQHITSDIKWAWDDSSFRKGPIVVVPEEVASKSQIYFIGDLHGDWRSLQRILQFITKSSYSAKVVFLGDLFDRSSGEDSLLCIRMLLDFAVKHPQSLLWIQGNHDRISEFENGGWHSNVEPCEFVDYLNKKPDLSEEGRVLSRIMDSLPVGLLIGNVWCSHGGVLQSDVLGLKSFHGFNAMTNDMCEDLVWCRMLDVKSKRATRVHHGAEVGFEQAREFTRLVELYEGRTISHFICAHRHESRNCFGYLPYDRFYSPSLTCQCICSFKNVEAFGVVAAPTILKYNGGSTPIPILFK